jgi:hypothetical protein
VEVGGRGEARRKTNRLCNLFLTVRRGGSGTVEVEGFGVEAKGLKGHAKNERERVRTREGICIFTNEEAGLYTCIEISNLKWPSENIDSKVIERARRGAREGERERQLKGKEYRRERGHKIVSTGRVGEKHVAEEII